MKAPLKITIAFTLAALLLAGCSVVQPTRAPEASYDFGPPPAAIAGAKLDKTVVLYDATAPVWLDVPHLHYRLSQSAPAQPRNYANSNWVMSPVALFTLRLKGRLADAGKGVFSPGDGVRADLALRVEVEEFTQVFDSPTASRGQVRVRASLSGGRDAPVQKTFSVDRPAATADADGGAKALIAASDEAIRQIVEWMAASGKGR